MPVPQHEGTVIAVGADPAHHFSKPLGSIMLIEGHGVEDDAHAGEVVGHRYLARRRPSLPNLREVHLMRSELFDDLRRAGHEVYPGAWRKRHDGRHRTRAAPIGDIAAAGTDCVDRADGAEDALRPDRPLPGRPEGLVAPAADGTTDFSILQNQLRGKSASMVMVAFDLLYQRLRPAEAAARGAKIPPEKADRQNAIQFSESFEVDGNEMYKHACSVGLEGVVSKVRDSRYPSGRAND